MIPASLKLLGHTITVRLVPEAEWKHDDCVGLYEAHRHRILIRDSISESLQHHTFYHELTHAILGTMGHQLNGDEVFVDMFSGLLHQAVSTTKFPGGKRK
jgi:Zn-dependent peptidase ImmA (M78 family)